MEFQDLLFLISGIGDAVETGSGATDAEIAEAESRLGVVFPDSFHRYLEEYGWISFEDLELHGLGRDVPPHQDLLRITESERSDMLPRLAETLLPLVNDGAGNYFCLDVERGQAGPAPIVFWDHEATEDQVPMPVASDFVEWLYGEISGRKEEMS